MPESRYKQLDGSIQTVLAKVGEQTTSLAVLAEHVKNIDASMAAYAQAEKERNGRVRKLEIWRGLVVGAYTVGIGVVAVLAKALFEHLTKHP